MTAANLSIMLLWIFILVYIFAGALDFGAGFWSMVYRKEKNTKAGDIANNYLSPSWEITNVFLVMFVVALVSFFPEATFTFGSVLMIPASIILILLTIRTAFLVFSHSVDAYREGMTVVSGITGILIPALLVVVIPVTHGGFISDDGLELLLEKVVTSPSIYAFIGLGITSTLFLSALFLAYYSKYTGDHSAYTIYRANAIWLAPINLIISLLTIYTLKYDANWLYNNIKDQYIGLVLSLIAFAIAYYFLRTNEDKGVSIALLFTFIQYLLASYVYGISHLPYLIYPRTVEESFTNLNMYQSLIYSYVIGTALLIPALIYHWKLFIKSEKKLKET